jgi:hypothetical protein
VDPVTATLPVAPASVQSGAPPLGGAAVGHEPAAEAGPVAANSNGSNAAQAADATRGYTREVFTAVTLQLCSAPLAANPARRRPRTLGAGFRARLVFIFVQFSIRTTGGRARKEAITMPSLRWLARLTLPVAASAAMVGGAATANAVTPQDQGYLNQLSAVGLTWPPQTEEALIGEAHLICYDLTWGWTPQQIADEVHQHLDKRGVTLLDIGTMVNAAHSTYCPGNVCDAPSLCT